jgi:hypothetical protein
MIWTLAWIAWYVAFVGIEGAALRNDTDGTLSVHLRRWFKVDTHLGRTVWLVVSGSLFAVFVVHIASGGA